MQCAFAFCWWAETRTPAPPDHDLAPPRDETPAAADTPPNERGEKAPLPEPAWPRPWRCWPGALRRVRAWLEPVWFLWRCWRAWSDQPPPPPLQALLDWLSHGYPLVLYDSS